MVLKLFENNNPLLDINGHYFFDFSLWGKYGENNPQAFEIVKQVTVC